MLRVTVELVPFGVEAMSKTIAEVCIANTHTDKKDRATYVVAGYHDKYGKIEEFGAVVREFPRNDGVLALLREVFSAEQLALAEILMSEELMAHTRLSGEVS
jgi:hypothetical protein